MHRALSDSCRSSDKQGKQTDAEGEPMAAIDLNELREKNGKKLPKSQRYIIETFLSMRAQLPLEKITVVELCRRADINKSTFYAYYHDIYALSEILQTEVIQKIIDTFDDPDEIISDPGKYTMDVLMNCEPDTELIRILFSGSQSSLLPQRLEKIIREQFYKAKPQHRGDMKHALMLSYKIYGAYYAFENNRQFDRTESITFIGQMAGAFCPPWPDRKQPQ